MLNTICILIYIVYITFYRFNYIVGVELFHISKLLKYCFSISILECIVQSAATAPLQPGAAPYGRRVFLQLYESDFTLIIMWKLWVRIERPEGGKRTHITFSIPFEATQKNFKHT